MARSHFKLYFFAGEIDNTYTWVWYLEFHSRYSQILHTVSILLTVTLAIWRYIAIK
jgi:thyrotropin-releasing hormone receptor